ncbi:glycosyltransferase family 39 protein [Paenibacillus sp. P26]|nr:glycosyltransferase family 39 protein [Paenibacillus sp. P26]
MTNNKARRFDVYLLLIAILAAFLNLFNIWKQTYVNAYYTSAVTSMLESFHNFFYASFDPGGFVTVDKPPVTFWVQTISAYLFGLHGWSVILPQALAGVGSVLLMYFMVKPTFGVHAARLASLVFACTPIAAAVARTNNVDSLLVFTLLLGAWMLFRGIRRGRWGWTLAAFGIIGLGFNMKMLQAYMVVPAFYLLYLLAVKAGWKKKLGLLAAATVLLGAISMSWAVIVDSIPKEDRPYIGSDQTNSVLELAFGYNGINRLTGNGMGGGGGRQDGQRTDRQRDNGEALQGMMPGRNDSNGGGQMSGMTDGGQNGDGAGQDATRNRTDSYRIDGSNGGWPGGGMTPGGDGQPPGFGGQGGPMGGRGGGMFGTGQPGPLRLFQSGLSGQISWLFPFAIFGAVGLLAGVRRRKPFTDKQRETLFWLAWSLPASAFFSVAGFFHQYYLIMLAPPIAALAGAGWVELWNQYRNREGWKTWSLPAGILATTALQLFIMSDYTQEIGLGWSIGLGAAGTLFALALIFLAKKEKLVRIAALAGMLVLLVVPLYWAATPLMYGGNSMLPEAGPQLKSSRQGFGGGGMGQEDYNAKLLQYVTDHNTGEKYLFATTRATTAAPYIIESGKPVMAMGGFSGSDPILTLDKVKELVKNKEVKFFLISSGGGPDGGSSEITSWIKENGTEVPSSEWQSSTPKANGQGAGMRMGMGGTTTLYEIKSQ